MKTKFNNFLNEKTSPSGNELIGGSPDDTAIELVDDFDEHKEWDSMPLKKGTTIMCFGPYPNDPDWNILKLGEDAVAYGVTDGELTSDSQLVIETESGEVYLINDEPYLLDESDIDENILEIISKHNVDVDFILGHA